MTQINNTPTNTDEAYVSISIAEVCEMYRPKILAHVKANGYRNEYDAEDVTQDILIRLIEGDYIGRYDASKGTRFSYWIMSKADLMMKADKAKRYNLSQREDIQDTQDPVYERSYVQDDEIDSVGTRIAIDRFMAYLETLPKTKTRDFALLFSTIVEMVDEGVKPTQTAIAKALGISRQAVARQLSDLAALDEDVMKQVAKLSGGQ